MTLSRIPVPLFIGPYVYQCQLVPGTKLKEKGQIKEGETSFLKGWIRVREGMTPERERETLLHEIHHAVWDCYGIPTTLPEAEREEGTIRPLSTGMYTVLLDNPWVVNYLFPGRK